MEQSKVDPEHSLIKPKTLEEVRAMIRSHKRNDFIFSSIGLLTITFALLTLLILFVDLVMDGYPKLNYQFFTDFPSRRAANAGILSAWVGSSLIMLVTFITAVPMGVAAKATMSKVISPLNTKKPANGMMISEGRGMQADSMAINNTMPA